MKIGILSGKETFTDVIIDEINGRAIPGLTAEFCVLDAARIYEPGPYRVILDRISHWITYYRTYLKNAALTGTCVVNNPFWFSADDKFFNYSLAKKLNVPVPRTVCLPSRDYSADIEVTDLRNLAYPLDWEGIINYVGFPAVLKPYDGYGWRDVTVVNNADELMDAYNASGEDVMMLQEFIAFEHYVRAFVVGKKHVLPIKYDPGERHYLVDHEHLSPQLGEAIVKDCVRLNESLGYDLNTVEFAVRDGTAYAIDFMNPVPEAKPEVITPVYFQWLIKHVADILIDYAVSGQATPTQMQDPQTHFPLNPEVLSRASASEWCVSAPVDAAMDPLDRRLIACGAVPLIDNPRD